MDQMLGGLFGGQDNDDDMRRRTQAQDFVSRYETGLPHEGYSDEEAVHNYHQVAGRLSPQQYEEAAAETFGRMSREDRRQLRQQMKQGGGNHFDFDNDDPRELARAAAQYRQQDASGGGLAGLFGMGGGGGPGGMLGGGQQGGGLGGMLGGMMGGGQQGGMMGGSQQGGSMLDNPLAKVAMGGIAAMAMKKMMGGG